jgi:arginase
MDIRGKQVVYILSCFDIGAGKKGAADGPLAVKNQLIENGIHIEQCVVLNENCDEELDGNNYQFAKKIDKVLNNSIQLESSLFEIVKKGEFPIVLSGDHSNAIGAISGLKNAHPDKRIGVIWVDAHADLHSPYTTPSGNLHGMPLAVLTGIDNQGISTNAVTEEEVAVWNQLKQLGQQNICPEIALKDIVFIGLRDAEEAEWQTIRERGVIAFEPEEIASSGIESIINKSFDYLKDCDLFYVSFDADSLDPKLSTGTGTPSPDGLKISEAESIFKAVFKHPKLGALEITEVNPNLQQGENEMATIISRLLIAGISA